MKTNIDGAIRNSGMTDEYEYVFNELSVNLRMLRDKY
jgi:hypothetical protein